MVVTAPNRATKRERERKARERRATKLERMRHDVDSLQRTALVVHTLHEDVWEKFLDKNALRLRHMLRLAEEARALRLEQTELGRLLQEHQLFAQIFAGMPSEIASDDWQRCVQRWRQLAAKHFRPWSLAACQAQMDAALLEVETFKWRTDKQTTGLHIFGWRDLQWIDPARGAFQFEYHKTFRGFDVVDYMNVVWDTYTDASTFQEVLVGPRIRGDHDILQQLGPNIVIVRIAERFPGVVGDIHVVYLVFRVKTTRGYSQCIRTLQVPELKKVINGPNDVAPSNYIWFQWELLDDDERGYDLRIGGCLGGSDINYAKQWMLDAFACVLRIERLATRRQLITSE